MSSNPAAEHLVLGTAGHIDHGKTALVRALTGVDTDRLPEEKARGITIALGFAPLDLPGNRRVSVVDVPGHEGLVRTMVSGATGIDVVLVVVAADEGVMPQTREHVAICELLGIGRGVVALTKIDLVESDVAELAEDEVLELLAGTALEGSPVVRVSAVSGEGLDELRSALAAALEKAEARTPRSGPPRLCVDRHFAAKGFGCVVTGTLVGDSFAVGETLEIQPSGKRARVRGVQNHGVSAERALPGLRCAVNLQGVEVADVARGDVLTRPGALVPTNSADAVLTWLPTAPKKKGTASAEFLVGTAERRARVAPIGSDSLVAGRNFARLHIEGDPVPLLPGDRFILRGFARTAMGGATLGGGVILDAAPPHRRRSDPALCSELEALAKRDPATDVSARVARAGLAGVARDALARETGIGVDSLDALLAALAEADEAVETSDGTWLSGASVADVEKRLLAALDAYHAAEPIQPGMPTGALRGALPANVPAAAAELVLSRLVRADEIVLEGDVARRAAHRVELDEKDSNTVERIAAELRSAGLEPPAERDLQERLGVTPDKLRELLAHLERQGRVLRTRDLWFDRESVDALREEVVAHLKEHGRLDTPTYKDLIGTTRRTAVPLMELFDEERLTLRTGNTRILRGRS